MTITIGPKLRPKDNPRRKGRFIEGNIPNMRRFLLLLDLVPILLISDSAGHHGTAGFMQFVVGRYDFSFAELAEALAYLD